MNFGAQCSLYEPKKGEKWQAWCDIRRDFQIEVEDRDHPPMCCANCGAFYEDGRVWRAEDGAHFACGRIAFFDPDHKV